MTKIFQSSIAFSCAVASCLALVSSESYATSIIRTPNPPKYSVEIEPHLNLHPGSWSFSGYDAGVAVGPGVRFTIPLMSPGFVKTINNSVGISFGGDVLWYGGRGPFTSFWAVYFPVAMQWNFWLTDKWSVFGEPGIYISKAFFDDAICDIAGCSSFRFGPTFYAGGRYHFNDQISLTMRLGYPLFFSIGASFF